MKTIVLSILLVLSTLSISYGTKYQSNTITLSNGSYKSRSINIYHLEDGYWVYAFNGYVSAGNRVTYAIGSDQYWEYGYTTMIKYVDQDGYIQRRESAVTQFYSSNVTIY